MSDSKFSVVKTLSDKYKLNQVSQHRIQMSIENKKLNKGKKKQVEREQSFDWERFEIKNQNRLLNLPSIRSENEGNSGRSGSERNQSSFKQKEKHNTKESIQNARVSNFYFKKLMSTDYICVLLTVLSFFINLVYTEADDDKELNLVFCGTTILTFILILTIIARYYYQLQLSKHQKVLKYSGNFLIILYKTKQLYPMLLEVAVVFIHPNVLFTDIQIVELEAYSLNTIQHEANDILALFLLLRIYIVLRGLVTQTIFYSPRASRLCRIHLCDHDLMFSVKCILKQYPLRALIVMFCLLLFVFGHAIKLTESPLTLVEHPVAMDFTNYLNCFWCIIVTMGTIGYGDYYPRTIPGRIVIFLTSICGVLLTSLLIVALSAYLNMQTEEHKAHICIKRLKLQKMLIKQASKAVLSVVKLGQQNKKSSKQNSDKNQDKSFQNIYEELKESTNNVKSRMREIKALVDNNNLYEQMQRYFTIIKNNFFYIYKMQETLKEQLMKITQIYPSEDLSIIAFAKTIENKALSM